MTQVTKQADMYNGKINFKISYKNKMTITN